jgi:peptidoglycan/xylan/chitin deacetylase (PgdA/CDA1 family)
MPRCLVAMYHYVRDTAATPFPEIRALPPAVFERQLDWLQSRFTVVGLAEIEAAAAGHGEMPADAAHLTFDDGFVDHHDTVFPILRRRGLSGTFFVAEDTCGPAPRLLDVHKTHFLLAHLGAEAFGRAVLDATSAARGSGDSDVFGVDRWEASDERAIKRLLNYDLPYEESSRVLDALFRAHLGDSAEFARQLYLDGAAIRAMADGGMSFGYHTRSHRMLARIPVDEQRHEIRGGVAWIQSLTGQRDVSFCYPWGGRGTYTADTVRLLGEAGYSVGFNTERRTAEVRVDGRFELPRYDTRDLPPYVDDAEVETAAAGSDRTW